MGELSAGESSAGELSVGESSGHELNTLYGNLEAKAPFSISTKQDQGDREQVVLSKTFKLSRFRWNRNPKRVTENVLRWSILSPLLS